MKTPRQTNTTNLLGAVLRCAMSRRRRLAWVVLALLPLFSLTALGDQEGDFVYQTDGGGAVVTAYVGPGGDVVIPAQLGGLPVKTIGALNGASSPFGDLTNVTSVTIPNGVTYIAYSAFSGCTGLTNLALPGS